MKDLFPPGDDKRYTLLAGGKELDGRNHLVHVKLDICNSTTGGSCNDILSQRFERRFTQESVRAMFEQPGYLDDAAASVAAEWWLKTALLKAHPMAYFDGRKATLPVWSDHDEAGASAPLDRRLFSWCVDGDPPPSDLSMWVSRRDRKGSPAPTCDPYEPGAIALPMWSPHGATTFHRSNSADFGVAGLRFHLLHHPGWTPVHPFEETGRALRLWPWPGGPIDLAALPRQDTGEQEAWGHLWQGRVRLMVEAGHDPFVSPWRLGVNWSFNALPGLPGVIGAGYS